VRLDESVKALGDVAQELRARGLAVRARLEQQLPPMYEVVDYYAQHKVLSTVNANRPIDEVSDALIRAIAQPVR